VTLLRLRERTPRPSLRAIVRLLAAAAAASLVAAACSHAGGANDRAAEARVGATEAVVAAVGDIACNSLPSEHERRCRYDNVAEAIRSMHPDRFLALGDLQYLHGSLEGFKTYYDRYFHDLKKITSPVPGNHETYTRYMKGYFAYFGRRAQPKGWWYPNHGGFYSFDLGGWHFIALNSQLCKGSTWSPDEGQGVPVTRSASISRGCGPGTPEYQWLLRDLAMHPSSRYPCTIAYYHHPLYVWSPWKPDLGLLDTSALWQVLDEHGVDVVLNGHYHNYQRFAPQDAFGDADPNGMVEFVVGTGGDTFENDFTRARPPNIEANQAHSFGVLKMTLHPDSYDFAFVTAPGQRPYQDSGHADCT
jgi:acid phosphatase type 7